MISINKVILQGNVGRDPELKKLDDNRSALNISIATGEYWKDKTTGERRERTDWHRVVFYGRLAEVVAEHVKQEVSGLSEKSDEELEAEVKRLQAQLRVEPEN